MITHLITTQVLMLLFFVLWRRERRLRIDSDILINQVGSNGFDEKLHQWRLERKPYYRQRHNL